jgi:mutator protein MutT
MKKKIIFDVVGALIKRKGKILVCQRFDDDLFGSLWEFPGGKVEKLEDKKAAIKREIKEELGIDIKVGKLINAFEDEITTMKITVYLYKCYITKGTPRCIECQNLRWATIDAIGRLALAPADRKIHTYLSEKGA